MIDLSVERLTPRQVRKRNKALAAFGLRLCVAHQGKPLPLTGEYFYRTGDWFLNECKQCRRIRLQQRQNDRRRTDAAYAERRRAADRASYWRNVERKRAASLRYWRARRAARMVRILAGTGIGG